MSGNLLRKATAFVLAFVAVTAAFAGCASEEKSSSSSSAVETTAAETTTAEETTETTAEPTTTEEITTVEETTEAQEIPSNGEVLDNIISAFGMVITDSSKTNADICKDWDIIADDADIDADAETTPEFLISAAMCATGFVKPENSLDEILQCAVEKNVIEKADISAVDVSKFLDIIENARYSWAHQTFDNHSEITLQEGVIDFSNELTADDYKIDGNSIELPAECADKIEAGSVFILPKDPATGEGGAYKAESVVVLNGRLIVNSSKTEIE